MPTKKSTKSGKTKKPSAAATAMASQAAQSAVIRAAVPQWFRIDPDQVQGNAGGFVWQISDKEQVIRYLIIGSEGGNYYQTPQQVSSQCASCVLRMTRTPDNFKWLIETIRQVSTSGRAAKQESTLLALATAIVFAPTPATKTEALNAVNDCVRILTHMYMLIGYIKIFSKAGHPTPTLPFSASASAKGGEATAVVVGSGFGRGIRRVFGEYFYSRTGIEIANLITKYQNREGWTIKDVLTLIHIDPKRMKDDDGRLAIDHVFKTKEEFAKILTTAPPSPAVNLFNTIKEIHALTERIAQQPPPVNQALASLPNYQSISDLNHIAHLITTAGLSREHLPSQLFKQRRIWEALLTNKGPSGKGKGMPLTALIRNLGKLSTQEIKIIEPRVYRDESPSGKLAYSLSSAATAPTMTPAFPPGHAQHYTEYIFHRLTNKHDIKYAKIHPYTILVAMLTYKKGQGDKGSLTWVPNVHILDALDHAFKLAFQNITPTGKRIKIALDVSGSMSAAFCTGSPIVNCATASIAMMMMTLYVERGGASPPNGASSALLEGSSLGLSSVAGAVGGRTSRWKTTQLPDGRTLYENTETNQCQFTKPDGGVAPPNGASSALYTAPPAPPTPPPTVETYRNTKKYLNLPLTAEEEQRRQRQQSGYYTSSLSSPSSPSSQLYLPELYPAPPRQSNVTICAFSNTLTELTNAIVGYMDATIDPITGLPGMSIADALKLVEMPFSSTDCALPIVRALENREPVDAFVIYTDSETYMGKIHPQAALEEYRRTMGIDAKLIVVGMTSNCLTIADPKDLNTLNLAGFDTATPRLINDFIAGGSLCPPPPPPPTTTTTPHQHPNPGDDDDAGDEFVMLDAMS